MYHTDECPADCVCRQIDAIDVEPLKTIIVQAKVFALENVVREGLVEVKEVAKGNINIVDAAYLDGRNFGVSLIAGVARRAIDRISK